MSDEAQKYVKAGEFLTDGEKEYLRTGEAKYESQTRYRIRKKAEGALNDLCLLDQYAKQDDIRRIFEKDNESVPKPLSDEYDPREEPFTNRWVAARRLVMLAWEGLRLNGVDKEDIFERVIVRGIEDGEADYAGVPHGRVESNINMCKLEPVAPDEDIDPVQKMERGLSLSGKDFQEINDRLSEHPDVDSIAGENIKELVEEYLIDD